MTGRPSIFEQAMSGAERTRRWREMTRRRASWSEDDRKRDQLEQMKSAALKNGMTDRGHKLMAKRKLAYFKRYVRHKAFDWDKDVLFGKKYGRPSIRFISEVCFYSDAAVQRKIQTIIKKYGVTRAQEIWREVRETE